MTGLRGRLRFAASRVFYRNSLDLYCAMESDRGMESARELQFAPTTEGQVRGPLLSVREDEASELMTALWESGVRPNNGEGHLSHVEAMRSQIKALESEVTFLRGLVGAHSVRA